MKIIKQGDLSRLEKMRRFSCGDCGCIWEANKTEYRVEADRLDTMVVCSCPTCGKETYAKNSGDYWENR